MPTKLAFEQVAFVTQSGFIIIPCGASVILERNFQKRFLVYTTLLNSTFRVR